MAATKGSGSLRIEQIRGRLSRAERVVALTGPGLSRDCGEPAFSTAGTVSFFEDPVGAWRGYDGHRVRLAGVRPGPAHQALAALGERVRHFTLATECIDGLHRLAGSRSVLELRGNIWAVRCTRCGMRSVNREVPIAGLPSCPACTGLARPDVAWQGEHLPQELLAGCFEALAKCEILIAAGILRSSHTGSLFAGVARKAGACIVEISPESTASKPSVDALLIGSADDILPQIVHP